MGIEAVYNYDYQPKNDWTFYFQDNIDISFNIKNIGLPFFQSFDVFTKGTGEKYYQKVNHITEFTMEIHETRDFRTYQYFKIWFDLVYDNIRQVFKLNPPVKNAVLIFNSYFTPIPTRQFVLNGVRFLGFENLNLNYEDGSALTQSVRLSVEEIKEI